MADERRVAELDDFERGLAALGIIDAPDRTQLNLTDEGQVRRHVRETRPALIVNAAAYTAVDKAEGEEQPAMIVNGLAPDEVVVIEGTQKLHPGAKVDARLVNEPLAPKPFGPPSPTW